MVTSQIIVAMLVGYDNDFMWLNVKTTIQEYIKIYLWKLKFTVVEHT